MQVQSSTFPAAAISFQLQEARRTKINPLVLSSDQHAHILRRQAAFGSHSRTETPDLRLWKHALGPQTFQGPFIPKKDFKPAT